MSRRRARLAALTAPLALLGCPLREGAAPTATRTDGTPDLAPTDPCLDDPRRRAPPLPPALDARGSAQALERGSALARSGDWAGAERAFRDALVLDPRSGLAHLGLADALERTGGDEERRREHLAAAVLDLPKNPYAHVRYADALETAGAREEALRHLRCALALKDGLRDARRLAVVLALDLEGLEAADALLAPLLDGSAELRDLTLAADVRAAQGRPEEAAVWMERAAVATRSAPLYRRAAALWEVAAQPEAASRARARADALDPPPGRRRLRDLPPSRVKRR